MGNSTERLNFKYPYPRVSLAGHFGSQLIALSKRHCSASCTTATKPPARVRDTETSLIVDPETRLPRHSRLPPPLVPPTPPTPSSHHHHHHHKHQANQPARPPAVSCRPQLFLSGSSHPSTINKQEAVLTVLTAGIPRPSQPGLTLKPADLLHPKMLACQRPRFLLHSLKPDAAQTGLHDATHSPAG